MSTKGKRMADEPKNNRNVRNNNVKRSNASNSNMRANNSYANNREQYKYGAYERNLERQQYQIKKKKTISTWFYQ